MTSVVSQPANMPETLTTRLTKGLASAALGQSISIVSSILLVSLFLRAWGTDVYGRWLYLTSFISYLQLLDFGGQNYFGNMLAREFIRGNEDGFKDRFSEGVSLFSCIALIGLFFLITALSFSELSFFGKNISLDMETRLILLFMGLSFLISVPGGVYVTAYRATGLFVRGTMVSNVLRVAGLLCYTIILFADFSPTIYAACFLMVSASSSLILILDIRHSIPVCRSIRPSIAAALSGRIHLGGSIQFWLLALANAISQQGVIIVLAATNAPSAVAIYATHRTASGLVGYIGTLLQAPLWPELSFICAQENKDRVLRISMLVTKGLIFMSGIAALCVWVLLPTIYSMWTGGRLQLQQTLLVLFLIQTTLAAGWNSAGWMLLASNRHYGLARLTMANAVFTVSTAAILAIYFGIIGVAIATLFGDIIFGLILYPWEVAKVLEINTKKIYLSILRSLVALTPIVIFLYLMSLYMHGVLFVTVAVVVILILLYPTAYFAFGKEDGINWILDKLYQFFRPTMLLNVEKK